MCITTCSSVRYTMSPLAVNLQKHIFEYAFHVGLGVPPLKRVSLTYY